MSINPASFQPSMRFGSDSRMKLSSLDNPATPRRESLDTFEKQEAAKKSILLDPKEWAALEKAQKEGRLSDAAEIIKSGRPR